jgi:hypothetical protein
VPLVANAIRCPLCADALTMHATEHGIVWVCGKCRAFGANLAVIRKVAPRPFVKHLWLAAVQQGVPSRHPCPSCSQPLQRFGDGVEVTPSCEVCCRCFLIWFDAPAADVPEMEGSEDALTRAFSAIRQLARKTPRLSST